MKKQRDIFKIKVRFKNLIPPVLPVRIQKRQRVEYIDMAMFFKSSKKIHQKFLINENYDHVHKDKPGTQEEANQQIIKVVNEIDDSSLNI